MRALVPLLLTPALAPAQPADGPAPDSPGFVVPAGYALQGTRWRTSPGSCQSSSSERVPVIPTDATGR